MKRVLQVLASGLVAGLASALVFLACDLSGGFKLLGVAMTAPADPVPWLGIKSVEGAIFGLLFLFPFALDEPQWKRGLIFGFVPALRLWLWSYPNAGWQFFGLKFGWTVPVAALAFSLLWGLLAGVILERVWADWRVASE